MTKCEDQPPPSKNENRRHFIFGCCGPSDATIVITCFCGIYMYVLSLRGWFCLLEFAEEFWLFCFPTAPQLLFKIWGQLPTGFKSFLLVNGCCMLNESDDSYLLLLREEEIWLSCGWACPRTTSKMLAWCPLLYSVLFLSGMTLIFIIFFSFHVCLNSNSDAINFLLFFVKI